MECAILVENFYLIVTYRFTIWQTINSGILDTFDIKKYR